jgi:multidrug efflux pump subunit AcrA (membrane-fusion protein)
MKPNLNLRFRSLSLLPLCLAVSAQVVSSNQPPSQGPVSYASASQLNGLLAQLEEASQAAQLDLAKLRVERWKTDSGSKRQAQGNTESIQRNLQTALPEIIAELRASPESLTSTFKLYRNLDALYDVFESVAESAGAFGSKDEFQSLENDVSTFEKARRSVADRMESLAGAKENEVTRLRAALQNAQANAPSQPPKKIVVDDTAPAKKPVKKKPIPKAASSTPANTPANPSTPASQPK